MITGFVSVCVYVHLCCKYSENGVQLQCVHSHTCHVILEITARGHLPSVPAEPHGGEVAPAELAYDAVVTVVDVPNLHRVVAAWTQGTHSANIKHQNDKPRQDRLFTSEYIHVHV